MAQLLTIFFCFFLFNSTVLLGDENLSIEPKVLYIKNQKLPTDLYVNQVIPISFEVLVADTIFDMIHTQFFNGENIEILNPESNWEFKSDNKLVLNRFAKILSNKATIPELELSILNNNERVDTTIIPSYQIEAKELSYIKNFSNIIADKLLVNNFKVEKYDQDKNILVLELESLLGNIKNFKLENIETQGIDWVDSTKIPIEKMFYFAIIPKEIENITFYYFNPKLQKYEKIFLEFDLSNLGQQISTHIDLNPNKRALPYLEILIYSIVVLFLLFMLFKTRSFIFIFLLSVVIATFYYQILYEKKIMLKEQTSVYLLPIENSTLFTTTFSTMTVVKLKEKKNYIKVLLPNNSIGWIRREDVIKN